MIESDVSQIHNKLMIESEVSQIAHNRERCEATSSIQLARDKERDELVPGFLKCIKLVAFTAYGTVPTLYPLIAAICTTYETTNIIAAHLLLSLFLKRKLAGKELTYRYGR